ncbi:Protein of unknown function [Leuconostoc citreum LBAE C10]|nr:Protein of unknown function [Leuconostoc citreum LBAE C10]
MSEKKIIKSQVP